MKRTIASVPLLALLALALAGCEPAPPPGDGPVDPRPTTPATATPIPVPTPTETLPPETLDPLDTVTRILLQTETASFCDDIACGVDGFRYDDDPARAIAKLTAVFGIEPTAESYEGHAGSTSYTYWWGDDFLIYFATGGTADVDHVVRVQASTASVEGVTIETEHGVRVGTPMSEALALADLTREESGETGAIYEAHFDVVDVAASTWSAVIAFRADDTSGPVTEIVGPITTGALPGY